MKNEMPTEQLLDGRANKSPGEGSFNSPPKLSGTDIVLIVSCGIVLPFLALGVELTTHLCASVFLNPLPSLLATFFVAAVPISNILALMVICGKNLKLLPLAAAFNSIAFCTSALYAFAFLPLTPFAAIAIIFFGLGLLCFAPLLAFIMAFKVRKNLRDLLERQGRKIIPADLCVSAFLIASAVLGFSANLTRAAESEIVTHPDQIGKNMLLMRAFGDRDTMLRACYGLEDINFSWTQAPVIMSGLFRSWLGYSASTEDYQVTNDKARELFYRATGKSFNSVPRPKIQPGDRYSFMDDDGEYYYYEYDSDFAGEAVGGVQRGLKLASSRIGGEFDPNAAVEHLVWTMQFEKDSYDSRELRAQIMLPPGAVVSGAWLLVNGERREGVFQARQEARQGYEKEARSGQSGLLIATAGPSRVLIQAPSINSNLELCLQIDAPMRFIQDDKVQTTLPALTERNFEVACKTDLYLVEILRNTDKLAVLKPGSDRIQLSNSQLFTGCFKSRTEAGAPWGLEHSRDPKQTELVAEDPRDKTVKVLQTIEKHKLPAGKPLLVVLDGSDSMASCIKPICDSIQKLGFSDATLVWAADQPVVVAKHISADSAAWSAAITKIKDSACVGGQDNAAALQLALTDCLPSTGANIVWLHGPQTIKFSGSKLADIWKTHSTNSALYEYQAVLGPNESIRSLDSSPSVNVVPHFGGIENDLSSLFTQLDGSRDVFAITRKFMPNDNANRVLAPAFLTQLCASDLIRNELSNPAKRQINSAIAESYRVVTPLTSCVVLLDPPPPEMQAVKNEVSDHVHIVAQMNQLSQAAQSASKKNSSDKDNGSSTAMGEAAAKDPAMVQQSQPSLIPTKPEPPLSLLMVCVGLIGMAIMFWQKALKKKCL